MIHVEDWTDKRVLITGVCGTVGGELYRQLKAVGPKSIIGVDNNESELFFLSEDARGDESVHFFLGDVRDSDAMNRYMRGVDIVLHTAALKHVFLCEEAPRESVQTNIMGVQNIVDAANLNDVERVIFTSSDKAVNPTNVMGTSKLMGERLMTAANSMGNKKGPIFSSTRFGNVLGSRGSVIPLFVKQIQEKGRITLTHEEMTRFIMSLEEAVSLVMDSVFMAKGGEVFVTKMPVLRILDLAHAMIDILAPRFGLNVEDVKIDVVGVKPGEKLYEELMNQEEVRRTMELDQYFVVTPAFQALYRSVDYSYPEENEYPPIQEPYNSSNHKLMTQEEIKNFLLENKLLD